MGRREQLLANIDALREMAHKKANELVDLDLKLAAGIRELERLTGRMEAMLEEVKSL